MSETGKYTYDQAGKLVGMRDEGGREVTNIYDYDDMFIVASVINAIPGLRGGCVKVTLSNCVNDVNSANQ